MRHSDRRLEQLTEKLRKHHVRAEAQRVMAARRFKAAVDAEIAVSNPVYVVTHTHPDYEALLAKASPSTPHDASTSTTTVVVLRHFPEPEPLPVQNAPSVETIQ